ncbi:MAG: hypothetical protein V3S16_05030 [Candidatus Desulfatibia sp.]|uniref:hypothetical protein n=1 Tax=Candidatus Desulfatibia sp. TaxID=3101189 RepID=UPI002F32563E
MKTLGKIIVCFLLVLPTAVQSFDFDHSNGSENNINFELSQTGQQRALEQRGVKVTRDKDDLVRRTVRAYGGDYVRNGETAAITLNGKTYQDFTIEIVEGKYLRIKTSDDTLYLEVVDKP